MGDFIQSILTFLTDLGYFGVALGLMIEIIPSEIVLAYAGYLVSQGHINFVGAVIAGVIGGTIAQIFVYWIGAYGGRPFLKKYGKYIFIHEKHIDIAEKWFEKYGSGVIFTARFIPVVRHAISIPAGITKMSLKKFTLYTTLAVIPWSILFVALGDQLSSNWKNVNEFAKPYIQPAMIIAIGLIVLYFIYKMFKKNK
ncbi:DedA family protein [Heyndrickxia sporothermodurans]|uniref:DedA family protein n=1 Tax=Heyndrickxia sporothermodurans TaxID=46224 RepID=UPI002E210A2F|nr:DedA family protein [Heyndrickxia sporothermodurans]MED3698786.1 DedA family protein [Heyndrickxia sporothermodurans]